MIGLDTNVLVRFFLDEAGRDRDAVYAFFDRTAGRDLFFVCDIVLVELVWTLRSRYHYSKDAILDALSSLLSSDDFRFQDVVAAREAVEVSRRTGADVSDALIASAGRDAGCRATMTLDVKASRKLPHMEAIA
jgi:predicted nucleic-acid-binding protein